MVSFRGHTNLIYAKVNLLWGFNFNFLSNIIMLYNYPLVPGERRAYLVNQGDSPHYAANGYDANSSAGLLDRVQPESLS